MMRIGVGSLELAPILFLLATSQADMAQAIFSPRRAHLVLACQKALVLRHFVRNRNGGKTDASFVVFERK